MTESHVDLAWATHFSDGPTVTLPGLTRFSSEYRALGRTYLRRDSRIPSQSRLIGTAQERPSQ
jgi:hypothetical protein